MLRASVPVANLDEHQPAIVINAGGEVHVISIVTIRQLANGAPYLGDRDKLVRLLSIALRDMMQENGG